DDATLRRALLAGYPDRVALRRPPGSPRLLLSSGTGATLAREIDDGKGEFLVVLDISGDLVRMAAPIEREWLRPTIREVVQVDDRPSGAGHPGSEQLLGQHLPAGAKGAASPIPETSMARGSVEGHADTPNEKKIVRLVSARMCAECLLLLPCCWR